MVVRTSHWQMLYGGRGQIFPSILLGVEGRGAQSGAIGDPWVISPHSQGRTLRCLPRPHPTQRWPLEGTGEQGQPGNELQENLSTHTNLASPPCPPWQWWSLAGGLSTNPFQHRLSLSPRDPHVLPSPPVCSTSGDPGEQRLDWPCSSITPVLLFHQWT